MGRNGVTQEQVLAAAERVRTRGEKVTVKRVREELGGTGSYTTISAALRELQDGAQPADGAIPPGLERGALGLVRSLWRALTGLVRQLVQDAQSGTVRRLDSMESRLNHSQNELAAMEKRWKSGRDELDELEHEVQENERHVQELTAALEETRHQLDALARKEEELLRHIDDHERRRSVQTPGTGRG